MIFKKKPSKEALLQKQIEELQQTNQQLSELIRENLGARIENLQTMIEMKEENIRLQQMNNQFIELLPSDLIAIVTKENNKL